MKAGYTDYNTDIFSINIIFKNYLLMQQGLILSYLLPIKWTVHCEEGIVFDSDHTDS